MNLSDYYQRLAKEDLELLHEGDSIHVAFGKADPIPAMVVNLRMNPPRAVTLAYLSAAGCAMVQLDIVDFNRTYKLYRKLLSVATPDGDIVAYEKPGGTYPGLYVTLRHAEDYDPNKYSNGQEAMLSMVEYIPTGEVVQDQEFSPGLFTRVFPDDGHECQPVTVPHVNYKLSTKLSLDKKARDVLRSALKNPDGSGLDLEHDIPMTVIGEFGDGCAAVLSVSQDCNENLKTIIMLVDEHGAILSQKPVNPTKPLGPVNFTHYGVQYHACFETIG